MKRQSQHSRNRRVNTYANQAYLASTGITLDRDGLINSLVQEKNGGKKALDIRASTGRLESILKTSSQHAQRPNIGDKSRWSSEEEKPLQRKDLDSNSVGSEIPIGGRREGSSSSRQIERYKQLKMRSRASLAHRNNNQGRNNNRNLSGMVMGAMMDNNKSVRSVQVTDEEAILPMSENNSSIQNETPTLHTQIRSPMKESTHQNIRSPMKESTHQNVTINAEMTKKDSKAYSDKRQTKPHLREGVEKEESTFKQTAYGKRENMKDAATISRRRKEQIPSSPNQFDDFVMELKRELSLEHVEVWKSFQVAFGFNSESSEDLYGDKSHEAILARKKKKVKLNSTAQKKLGAIHKYVTKKVRKSHIAQKSQLVNDRNYYRECEKKRPSSVKSSGSLTRSSGGHSESGSKRKRKLKTEPDTSIPPVIEMVSTSNSENSHKKIQEGSSKANSSLNSLLSQEETTEGQDKTPPAVPTPFRVLKESNKTDTNNILTLHKEREQVSEGKMLYPSKEAQKETSLKPPLAPNGNKPRKSKKTIPWISALREKQKRSKKELTVATLDDDDCKSVNTVDLETSAAESLGKNTVISMFGKKLKKNKTSQRDTKESEPASPWNVKLRSVPKRNEQKFIANETVFSPEGKKNFFQDCIQSPESEIKRSGMLIENLSTLNIQKNSDEADKSKTLNIYAGDVIDLLNLPVESFGYISDTLIIPITNNSNDDRSQVAVLGQDMLLIASRFSNNEGQMKLKKDPANVLWFTHRSEIQSLALNNSANGVSISITDGTSFPLNFKSPRECFSFVQDYYQVEEKKDLIPSERDEISTASSSIKEDDSTRQRNYEEDNQEIMSEGPSEAREKSNFNRNDEFKLSKNEERSDIEHYKIPSKALKDKSNGNFTAANSLNGGDQAVVSRFQKMLKYNVPVSAVKHRMSLDGVRDEVVKAVLNEGHNQKDDEKEKEFLSDEENFIVKKYGNMLNIGMPKDAVLHAMRKDTVEEHLIATLMNDSKLSSQLNKTPSLTTKQERSAKKYRLLLKTNVSHDGVRRKMEFENADQAVIVNVLGKSEHTTIPQNSFITPLKDTKHQSETSPTSIDRVALKYRKMLKMGIPSDAVRHSMIKDNVGEDIIEAVFGPVPKSSNGSVPVPIPSEPASVEGVASKYRKMLKMGIPSDAVRHSMIKDNVGEDIIEAVFGPSSKPSKGLSTSAEKVASKYRKMLKMGIPSDAVRHSMIKDNVGEDIIENVLGLKSTSNISNANKRKSRLVNIHWTKLSKEAVQNQNCIWNRSSKKPKLLPKTMDISSLEELFQKRKPNKDLQSLKKDKHTQSVRMANIIDPRRAQNVAISLQAFKDFQKGDLVSIIDDMDPEHRIEGDRVLFLTGLLPTQIEAETIKKFEGDESQLVPVEKFFRLLLSVKDVNRKIKIMETMEMLNHTLVTLRTGYEILRKVCEEIMKSEKLQLVLEAVLTIGNIMNEGTSTGGAAGFKFDSLLKLTQTKSIDGKMTVLDYIVSSFISRGERSVLNLSDDFPDCSSACRLQFNDMDIQAKNVGTSLKNCTNGKKARLKENRGVPTPGTFRLDSFLKESEEGYKKLESLKNAATKSCVDLSNYCGEDGGPSAALELLRVLHEFLIQVDASLKKYDKVREAEARKDAARKRKENMRRATPGTLKSKSRTTGLFTSNSMASGNSLDTNKTDKSIESPRRKLFHSTSDVEEREKWESKGHSSNDEIPIKVETGRVEEHKNSHSVLRRRSENLNLTGPIFGCNPIPHIDPRSALLQAVIRRKPNKDETDELIEKTNKVTFEDKEASNPSTTSEIKTDPRNALLNAIMSSRNVDKKNTGPSESTTEYRTPPSPERDPRSALLNAITSSRNSDNSNSHEHPGVTAERRSPSTTERDPRSSLLNAIASRREADEKAEDIETDHLPLTPEIHVDARSALLNAITNRNINQITDQSGSAETSQEDDLSSLSDMTNVSTGGKSMQSAAVLSSKSLGSGILPDLEVALIKYENE